ncbi:MAG: hypothetical protein ABJF88_14905 [Rhodothermales bacterium]
MPQYELDHVGPAAYGGRVRGRTPEEAVRRAADLDDDAAVTVGDDADLHGWQEVRIDGEPSGRVRLHQRMQFRRD